MKALPIKSRIHTALNKLDEMYEQRAACAINRMNNSVSAKELRVVEGEFDAYFKRSVSELENLLTEIARDSQ